MNTEMGMTSMMKRMYRTRGCNQQTPTSRLLRADFHIVASVLSSIYNPLDKYNKNSKHVTTCPAVSLPAAQLHPIAFTLARPTHLIASTYWSLAFRTRLSISVFHPPLPDREAMRTIQADGP